jgi:hypothetical protein
LIQHDESSPEKCYLKEVEFWISVLKDYPASSPNHSKVIEELWEVMMKRVVSTKIGEIHLVWTQIITYLMRLLNENVNSEKLKVCLDIAISEQTMCLEYM